MRGNPVAYRNLYRHLNELLTYLEISLDSEFILEELDSAIYESRTTFGKRHTLTLQMQEQFSDLYDRYIDRKAEPLDRNDSRQLKFKIQEWLIKFYRKHPH